MLRAIPWANWGLWSVDDPIPDGALARGDSAQQAIRSVIPGPASALAQGLSHLRGHPWWAVWDADSTPRSFALPHGLNPVRGNGAYIRNRTELSRKVEVWNEGWSLQVEIKVSPFRRQIVV